MEFITQTIFGVFSLLMPTTNPRVCEFHTLKASEVISLFVPPDVCLKEESPSWKYLYNLIDYYQLFIKTILPYISIASEHFINVINSLAGWREHFFTHYQLYSNVLMNDQLFMFVLKLSSLLLFLFIMHWLKQFRPSSYENPQQLKPQKKSPSNGCLPSVYSDKTISPQKIICEFEFKTPAELRAEAEAVNSVMLDMEEKRRRKRFSKKRKCVSAGPILIHLRQSKKHKKAIATPYIVAMLPPEEARDHYLPLRSKPLVVGRRKPEAVIVNNTVMDHEETEIAYMCVYIHYKKVF